MADIASSIASSDPGTLSLIMVRGRSRFFALSSTHSVLSCFIAV